MGMLGALQGLGQGLNEVGTAWATEARDQRMAELKEKMSMAAEQRAFAQKKELTAEEQAYRSKEAGIDRAYRSKESEKDRAARAEEARKTHNRNVDLKKADAVAELERDKMRAGLGIGVTSGEGPSKIYQRKIDASEQYQKYQDAGGELSLKSWAKERGLADLFPDAGRKVVRTGTTKDGRKVVMYEDGTTAYAE